MAVGQGGKQLTFENMVIDSHHHFWKFNPAEYGWIDESMAVIRRDFVAEDLREAIGAAGVDGAISVQARQSIEETHWLLSIANENKFVRGVVGWVPLVSERVKQDLEAVAADPKLRGVRHVLQDEADDQFIAREDFNRGVSLLKEFGLAFDILIFEAAIAGGDSIRGPPSRSGFRFGPSRQAEISKQANARRGRKTSGNWSAIQCLLQDFGHGHRGRLAKLDPAATAGIF